MHANAGGTGAAFQLVQHGPWLYGPWAVFPMVPGTLLPALPLNGTPLCCALPPAAGKEVSRVRIQSRFTHDAVSCGSYLHYPTGYGQGSLHSPRNPTRPPTRPPTPPPTAPTVPDHPRRRSASATACF